VPAFAATREPGGLIRLCGRASGLLASCLRSLLSGRDGAQSAQVGDSGWPLALELGFRWLSPEPASIQACGEVFALLGSLVNSRTIRFPVEAEILR